MTYTRRLQAAWLVGISASALVGSACSARLVSERVASHPVKKKLDGLIYTLPRTVVKVTLPIVLVETSAGKLDSFAPLFVPDQERRKPGRSIRLKRPAFSTFGEPDPTQVYTARAVGNGALEQSLSFQFTEQGAVTGAKGTATDTTADLVLSGAGAITGILTRTVLGGGQPIVADHPELSRRSCNVPRADADDFKACFLKTSILGRNFDQLPPKERRRLLDVYADVASEENHLLRRARQVYELITALTKGKNDLLTTLDSGGGDAQFLYGRNAETATRLTEMFIGKRDEISWEGVFELRPTSGTQRQDLTPSWTSQPILRYVPDGGLCETMDLRGAEPPPASMFVPAASRSQACDSSTGAREVILSARLEPEEPQEQLAGVVATSFSEPEEASIYFAVPAQVRVALTSRSDDRDQPTRVLGQAVVLLAQMGVVTAVPSDVGGRSVTHDLQLYDATGGLRSYNLVSKPALESGMVGSLSESANALLEARNRQLEKEREAADDLNKLKRQYEMLDLKLKIKAHCETLGIPEEECTP